QRSRFLGILSWGVASLCPRLYSLAPSALWLTPPFGYNQLAHAKHILTGSIIDMLEHIIFTWSDY
ncbi:hypothetical protein LLG95_15665, partial [bacterium]|nr:hypothetical protein [bacterium]